MLGALTDRIAGHETLLAGLGTASAVLLALSVVVVPWLLARLPHDYFLRAARGSSAGRSVAENADAARRPREAVTRAFRRAPALAPWRLVLLLARTVVGVAFVVLGLIMMVTPGPGVVALLLGLSLCEFPGKRALLRRLAGHPSVFASLNWIRRRAGSPPFLHPDSG